MSADLAAVKQWLCMKLNMFYLLILKFIFSGRMVAKAAVTKVMRRGGGTTASVSTCSMMFLELTGHRFQLRSFMCSKSVWLLSYARTSKPRGRQEIRSSSFVHAWSGHSETWRWRAHRLRCALRHRAPHRLSPSSCFCGACVSNARKKKKKTKRLILLVSLSTRGRSVG